MRLIDADAMVCLLYDVEGTAPILGLSRIIEISDVVKIIEDAPTVDVVPVRRGRWTTHRTIQHDGEWYCDQCGYEPTVFENTPYCPHCGADMQEVENND